MRPQLVFWRNVPHDVDLGYIDYLSEHWGNKITVVCKTKKRHKSLHFGTVESDNVTTVILDEQKDKNKIISDIISSTKGAIHIFAGMRGDIQKYLDMYLDNVQTPRVVINAEIPSFTGNILEQNIRKILLRCVYRKLCRRYGRYIDCFLPLGQKGCKIYLDYGFSSDSMYPFMYCPRLTDISDNHNNSDEVRFLYVGRMDVKDKGLDNLTKAVDMLSEDTDINWSLDIVGGYGDDTQSIYNWSQKHSNVNCVGTVAFDNICADMCSYDVCVVPSHYDGWNMTPNMAIATGCATIITNKATSDELVRGSDTGIIIKDSPKELYLAMKKLCSDKHKLAEYKENTKSFRDKISDNTVGQYFIDILDYTYKLNDIDKPQCPWI